MADLVGLSSSGADSNLDGQVSVKFTTLSVDDDDVNVALTPDYFVIENEVKSIFTPGLGIDEVANLREISDVISTSLGAGIGTHFVLTYDASADNFVFISPDAVVDSAVGSVSGPTGFSTSVINNLVTELDTALDNKIDLDGGTWA